MQAPHAPSWGCLPNAGALVTLLVGILTLSMPAAAEAGVREVHVVLVGRLAKEPALPERFASWFDAGQYHVSVREQPTLGTEQVLSPPPDGAVHVWVTLHHATEARLYFAMADADRAPLYSFREVTLDAGLDEVGAERLSQIVHLSTLALFEGQGEHERAQVARMLDEEPVAAVAPAAATPPPPPVLPPSPPPPAPRPPALSPPPRDHRALALGFGLGYAVSPRSEEGLWHGPAAHAGLRFACGVVLELEGQGFLPHEEDVGAVRLRFWGVALGVGAGWGRSWGSGWSVSGALGPRVEVVSYQPNVSLAHEITLTEGETELRPELGITGRLGVQGASLGAGMFLRAAYALSRTHYDLKTDTSAREIAAPSRFLPTAGLELTF